MPWVINDGTYKVYVYGKEHNPPHCHVIWAGEKQAVVHLNPIEQRGGNRLPRAGMALVREHKDTLLTIWNTLNP